MESLPPRCTVLDQLRRQSCLASGGGVKLLPHGPWRRPESNWQPLVCNARALPLGHAPVYYVDMGYSNPEKQREYMRNWMTKRRSDWIEANGPCVECGSRQDLEVDHIDPASKTMNTGGIWSRTLAVREVELSLCQVLCRRCHREKTKRQRVAAKCGSHSRYVVHGCRCRPCKDAHSASMREWRRSQAAVMKS